MFRNLRSLRSFPKIPSSVISSSLNSSSPPYCHIFTSTSFKRHVSRKIPQTNPLKGSPVLSQPKDPRKPLEDLYLKFNRAISNAKEPTKLYEATSLGSYVITTRTTAVFCFLYAGWNFYTTTSDPLLDVSHFTTYALGGICILMGAMGTVFIRRGTSLITRITASSNSGNIPEIRINVRRVIGFMKPREIVTSPSRVTLSSPIFVSKQQLQVQDMRRIREAFHERAVGPRLSFWKEPLKKISYLTWKTLINMRRAFTQEGFVYVEVKGISGTFRLDITGYFGDEFLAFERCVAEESR
ncbi:hypothetical protein AJ78_04620 [Emergomyces pasteurianus Ep9510]|uniref:Uncharacterized protein n=1 Tax=Emergomyces pasteurianus Ep9510 TaxID=1447872 RepID=A0A1J9QG14_9EURO|nr:hypothetical protein AJ78_04620 [Emergomyces pasteurianus Ep9510]